MNYTIVLTLVEDESDDESKDFAFALVDNGEETLPFSMSTQLFNAVMAAIAIEHGADLSDIPGGIS